MNTKAIAVTIVFAAVTIALNPAFTGLAVPFPFFPYVTYYLWEIPIVAAAFFIGLRYGILITFVNMIVLLATAPGFAPQQPFYQSTAAIAMLLGIYLSMKIAARKTSLQEAVPRRRLLVFSTVMGILFRVGIMAVLAYVLFRYPIIGFSLPEPIILTIIPLIAIYDATLPLYTVPIGYLIARTVGKNLRVGSQDPNVTLTVKR
jgi:riboflavin transporter FmnP